MQPKNHQGSQAVVSEPRLSGSWRTWLPSRGSVLFTLLVVGLLLYAGSVGALPLRMSETTGNSINTISYQGLLVDTQDNPLTGVYEVIFRLYDAPSGGAPLWEESWIGANSVEVSDGLLNVMLGSLNPTLASAVEGHDDLYLGITVGTDDEMDPRVQLGAVPFSMAAQRLMGQLTTDQIADGAVTTAKLALGAVTQHQAVSVGMYATCSSTEWVDMPVQTVTLSTEGGAVLVLSSGSYTAESQVWVVGYWRIMRDDTVELARNNQVFSQNDWTTTTLFGLDTPPAGSHTYKVQWRCTSGTLKASGGAHLQNFAAIEFKR